MGKEKKYNREYERERGRGVKDDINIFILSNRGIELLFILIRERQKEVKILGLVENKR